jgi:hypothetical protein
MLHPSSMPYHHSPCLLCFNMQLPAKTTFAKS